MIEEDIPASRFALGIAATVVVLAILGLGARLVASVVGVGEVHICGQGPVVVQMAMGDCCACPHAPTPKAERIRGDTYRIPSLREVDPSVCCACPTAPQRWSDFPECGGELMHLGID